MIIETTFDKYNILRRLLSTFFFRSSFIFTYFCGFRKNKNTQFLQGRVNERSHSILVASFYMISLYSPLNFHLGLICYENINVI